MKNDSVLSRVVGFLLLVFLVAGWFGFVSVVASLGLIVVLLVGAVFVVGSFFVGLLGLTFLVAE